MGAAVDASPLGGLMYFPTALVRDQLPVGLDELGGVPTMASTPGATLKARLWFEEVCSGNTTRDVRRPRRHRERAAL